MGDRDSGSSFIIGLVFGAAIGAAIGFLYAPRPGSETRAMLKEKAEKAAEMAREAAEKAREAAAETRERIEEKLSRKKAAES